MIDLYVLNLNLKVVGIVEDYQSLIWVHKYNDVGTCEIAIAATLQNIALLQKGFYIIRKDDEMVCRIQKIEIETSPEKSLLIVTGGDVTSFFDQRIMAGVRVASGTAESVIHRWILNECLAGAEAPRQFKKPNGSYLIALDEPNAFPDKVQETVGYANLGTKIKEYCKAFGWGLRLILDRENVNLLFSVYKGTDRSASVMFSPRFDNLASSKYSDDITKMGNVAVMSYSSPAYMNVSGDYSGAGTSTNRYEIYVNGSKTNRSLTWKEFKKAYPPTSEGGTGYYMSSTKTYIYTIDFQIYTAEQRAALEDEYGSSVFHIDPDTGLEYFENEIAIADVPNGPEHLFEFTDSQEMILRPELYEAMLLAEGFNVCQNRGELISFEGAVIPNITFVYKRDYFLGDIVKVENEFGISANARITEVLEAFDENGYKCEPKFEYLED